MTGEKFHFLQRRYVQDMHARTGFVRDRDKTLRRLERGNFIAPDRVRTRVALDAQVLALVQSRLVFGVERRTAADDFQHSAQAGIVGDQQGAGG